jgi:DNA-binding transcriptional MerR regulator
MTLAEWGGGRLMITSDLESFNIKEASQATGLTPSVLRIWELRYGWPNPKRKINGYRTYQRHLIEDLKKVANLVKNGLPISSIIIDSMPRWPTHSLSMPSPRLLARTRALPVPIESNEAMLNRELIQAFANLNPQSVKELLQRIFWSVRPSDEPKTALVPALVALAELRTGNRPMPEMDSLLECVKERCQQLLRMQRHCQEEVVVVPARTGDYALASLVAVMLGFRGISAHPWQEAREPTNSYVLVSDGECLRYRGQKILGVITTLGAGDSTPLCDLLETERALPWMLGMRSFANG